MRCGRYIRRNIESKKLKGWEHWLVTPDRFKKRTVDTYLFLAFYLLYLIYYAGSSYLTFVFAREHYGIIWSSVFAGFYIAIGVWSAIFIFQKRQISTTTSCEKLK